MEKNTPIRHVALVERCLMTESGLCHLFKKESRRRYNISVFRDITTLRQALQTTHFYAVVYSLPGGRVQRQESLLFFNEMEQSHPEALRIVLANNDAEAKLVYHFSPARLHAVVSKSVSLPVLTERLLGALKGMGGEQEKENALRVINQTHLLSPTEREILRYMTYGYSIMDIATQLDRNIKTIRSHKFNVMSKLGVNSDIGLLSAADILISLPVGDSGGLSHAHPA